MQEREKAILEMEAKLKQCEADLESLIEINHKMERINENIKILSEYYTTKYRDDYENIDKFEKHYDILNQDSIWNVISDQYNQKIALIKKIAASL